MVATFAEALLRSIGVAPGANAALFETATVGRAKAIRTAGKVRTTTLRALAFDAFAVACDESGRAGTGSAQARHRGKAIRITTTVINGDAKPVSAVFAIGGTSARSGYTARASGADVIAASAVKVCPEGFARSVPVAIRCAARTHAGSI